MKGAEETRRGVARARCARTAHCERAATRAPRRSAQLRAAPGRTAQRRWPENARESDPEREVVTACRALDAHAKAVAGVLSPSGATARATRSARARLMRVNSDGSRLGLNALG